MVGDFACFCCHLLTFSKITFFQNILSGTLSQCQTVWIQIMTDILSVLIWVQTVNKGYQQTMKIATGKETSFKNVNTLVFNNLFSNKKEFWTIFRDFNQNLRNFKVLSRHQLSRIFKTCMNHVGAVSLEPSQVIHKLRGHNFDDNVKHYRQTGPEVIKLFICSTQLSMKFQLLVKN